MSTDLPSWVETEEDRVLLGRVAGYGAPSYVISSRTSCEAFLSVREQQPTTGSSAAFYPLILF
ncbi:hypothetical protein EON65_49285 [archaeon]|nr:MAG: hypothetical protein EON65_49285 [archaeon]